MRVLSLCLALTLSACANMPSLKSEKAPASIPVVQAGLTSQELAIGECGVFFWTLSSPPVFTFFHKEGADDAKFYYAETETILTPIEQMTTFSDGSVFEGRYQTPTGKTLRIRGQFSDMLEGGQRITEASIHKSNAEGWQEIIPVSGVYVCR